LGSSDVPPTIGGPGKCQKAFEIWRKETFWEIYNTFLKKPELHSAIPSHAYVLNH